MSFLYPAFLAAAVAIAVPIVLHLLRRDVAPEVPFTAVRLLRGGPVERSRRRRLRDLMLLAARVAALLLLAAAFARPYAAGSSAGGLRVVAVDRSFSMGAPGMFDRTRDAARAAVDEADGQVAVMAFDDRAEVVAPPGSAADARAAIDALEPGVRATRYRTLVDRVSALDEGAGGLLVVVTDLQRAGSEPDRVVALPPGWRIEVRDAGRTAGNLALAALHPDRDRIVATIRNDWPERKRGRLRVMQDGRELDAVVFEIAPAATSEIAVPVRVPDAGGLTAAIEDAGGLPADDVRHAAVGSAARPRARLIVGPGPGRSGAFYLARALESAEGDGGFTVDVVPASALSRASAESLNGSALVVLASTRGLERRARDAIGARVREGAGLVITASPEVEPAVIAAMFGWSVDPAGPDRDRPLTFGVTDPRHPIFRPFGPLVANLGRVRVDRAWRVKEDGWSVPARFSDGTAALLDRREGSGRVLLFASDLDRRWNDFPLHPSFVPFVMESARYAAARASGATDVVVSDVPDGVEPRPGLHRHPEDGRLLAVNVDIRESDPGPIPADEFLGLFRTTDRADQAAGLHAIQIESGQAYWRYGLLLMLAALVAESFAGRVHRAG